MFLTHMDCKKKTKQLNNHELTDNINKSYNRDNTFNLLTENKRKKETNKKQLRYIYRLSDTKYSLQAAPIFD